MADTKHKNECYVAHVVQLTCLTSHTNPLCQLVFGKGIIGDICYVDPLQDWCYPLDRSESFVTMVIMVRHSYCVHTWIGIFLLLYKGFIRKLGMRYWFELYWWINTYPFFFQEHWGRDAAEPVWCCAQEAPPSDAYTFPSLSYYYSWIKRSKQLGCLWNTQHPRPWICGAQQRSFKGGQSPTGYSGMVLES